jgi:hypothetical protein
VDGTTLAKLPVKNTFVGQGARRRVPLLLGDGLQSFPYDVLPFRIAGRLTTGALIARTVPQLGPLGAPLESRTFRLGLRLSSLPLQRARLRHYSLHVFGDGVEIFDRRLKLLVGAAAIFGRRFPRRGATDAQRLLLFLQNGDDGGHDCPAGPAQLAHLVLRAGCHWEDIAPGPGRLAR